MSRLPKLHCSQFPHLWRVGVCVLLVALVLYNPFGALNGSSGRLSYDSLARNRAFVGSSELQHFSPVSKLCVSCDLQVDLRDPDPVRCAQQTRPNKDQQEVVPAEPAFLAGVWFRPPPSL